MNQEILASSELYATFPRHMSKDHENDSSVIPKLVVPNSKYSSTETEFSSDDDSKDYEDPGRLTVSTFSSGSGRGRKYRKRRKRKSSTMSIAEESHQEVDSSLRSVGIGNNNGGNSQRDSTATIHDPWSNRFPMGKGFAFLIPLNSIYDLKHAVGRHRGISGSSSPAVDAAVFAMFYITDVFDHLLSSSTQMKRFYCESSTTPTGRRDVINVLKKEIIYSLRMSYYCPAAKITKLMKLIEEHYSACDEIQDISGFLDLFFGKILSIPPFLRDVNGSHGYIHRVPVESQFKKNYQPVLTTQRLLRNSSLRGGPVKFLTVPYPVLIIEVNRTQSSGGGGDLSSLYLEDYPPPEPVIPNLEINIGDLVSRRIESNYYYHSCESISTNTSFMTSTSIASEANFQMGDGRGHLARPESRFVKGLKSAWKVMFKYMEDLTSSSQLPPDSAPSIVLETSNDTTHHLRERNNGHPDIPYKRLHRVSCSSEGTWENDLVSSFSSVISGTSNRSNSPMSPQPDVRMELVAIICYSPRQASNLTSVSGNFSGYSVYSKAGKDIVQISNSKESSSYAPWILYQPRNGVAPQVTLIENFGKWINSLERNHENLSLYQVPLEIRRVLEDSKLFIYKKED